jgi:hypothetical protein
MEIYFIAFEASLKRSVLSIPKYLQQNFDYLSHPFAGARCFPPRQPDEIEHTIGLHEGILARADPWLKRYLSIIER